MLHVENTSHTSRIIGARKVALIMGISLLGTSGVFAQAPSVPIVKTGDVGVSSLPETAEALRAANQLLNMDEVRAQLARTHCTIKLAEPQTRVLTGRQVYEKASTSYLRIGWYFLCPHCNIWHFSLGGGFYVTEDGVAATACHVGQGDPNMREGYFLAVTDDGTVLPVTEILAANYESDVCLVRVKTQEKTSPLALNSTIYPGDTAWCYSNPMEHGNYFSKGVVNRFLEMHTNGQILKRMDVTADWAPGSSGSAVLDECGNAIGLVSAIEVLLESIGEKSPLISFHHAARAEEIRALVNTAETE